MSIVMRELQLPEDYEALARLLNQHYSEPTSAEALAEDDAKMFEKGHTWKDDNGLLAGYDRTRRVAITEDGQMAGYITTWRAPWTEPGYLCITLAVDEHYRQQGIGSQLLAHGMQWGKGIGADAFISQVWDDQPHDLRFAQSRGFCIERHTFQSLLPLDGTQSTKAPGLNVANPEGLLAEGIKLTTLADLPGEETLKKLYELSIETFPDIPGYMGSVPDYDSWRKWYLEVDGFVPELVIIAVDGEGLAGYTNVIYKEETNGLYHEYTTVHRDYRGKKIAQALKLKSIQLGLQRRASYIRTDNDSLNEPILSINRKLGYQPLRGSYRILASMSDIAQKPGMLQSD